MVVFFAWEKKFDEFEGQKILVIGGACFVGGNLVKALLKYLPREVVIFDNLLSSERVTICDYTNIARDQIH